MAVGLITFALATSLWIVSYPKRIVTPADIASAKNVSLNYDSTKFEGYVAFGLFSGRKVLNSGFGTTGREKSIWGKSFCELLS